MSEPSFTIHDTFFIKGRGLILLFLLDLDAEPRVRVCVGDEIELTLEGGDCVRTTVTGVELIQGCATPGPFPLGILVALVPDDHLLIRGARVRVVK